MILKEKKRSDARDHVNIPSQLGSRTSLNMYFIDTFIHRRSPVYSSTLGNGGHRNTARNSNPVPTIQVSTFANSQQSLKRNH
jgi:hypothetical protein